MLFVRVDEKVGKLGYGIGVRSPAVRILHLRYQIGLDLVGREPGQVVRSVGVSRRVMLTLIDVRRHEAGVCIFVEKIENRAVFEIPDILAGLLR